MSKGNEPAYPSDCFVEDEKQNRYIPLGLSKREYFAGLAMQGVLAHGNHGGTNSVVAWSVDIADALLAELEKTNDQ